MITRLAYVKIYSKCIFGIAISKIIVGKPVHHIKKELSLALFEELIIKNASIVAILNIVKCIFLLDPFSIELYYYFFVWYVVHFSIVNYPSWYILHVLCLMAARMFKVNNKNDTNYYHFKYSNMYFIPWPI